jgi:uncharacterized protein YggU (UPF0235/DUF167 family)
MRICIRVIPSSPVTRVGGARGEALLVRVQEPAVEGKATEAALRALATALGVRRRDVELASGATSRDKLVEVAGDLTVLVEQLRAGA